MPDAQFIDRVSIRSGKIGNDHIRTQQQFVHGLIDYARMNNVVGADAFEAGLLDRLLNDDAVRFVEVIGLLLLEIGFGPEAHYHETFLLCSFRYRRPPGSYSARGL